MLFREIFYLTEKSSGKSYELGKTFSLGRSTTNDIILKNSLVSRVHCKITRHDDVYLIEDLKSKNGLLINQHFLKGRKTLQEGDVLEIPPRGDSFVVSSRTYPGPLLYTLLIILFVGTLSFGIKTLFFKDLFKQNNQSVRESSNSHQKETPVSIRKRIKDKLIGYGESEQYIKEETISRILVYMNQFKKGQKYTDYTKGLAKYGQTFDLVFKKYGIPADFAVIPSLESDFNPRARNRSGARGMWQLLPGTAREMGLTVNNKQDQRIDPEKSTEAAARHIKNLLANFGKDGILLAAASYNWGDYNLRYTLKKINNLDNQRNFLYIVSLNVLPAETEEYVLKFVALNTLHDLTLEQDKNNR